MTTYKNSLTTAQIREADRRCIEEIGIPGVVLMNNAGRAVFAEVDAGPVGVVCGKGNNGGDGFVAARYALLAGYDTRVLIVADYDDIKGDARIFMNAYQKLGGRITQAHSESAATKAVAALSDCSVLIDALLGTGITGEVRGPVRAALEAWPKVRTIAVDVPSGLNADTGECLGPCIEADVTVTFQFAKKGYNKGRARQYLGRLVVADIGIPEVCADDVAWNALGQAAV